MLELCGQIVFGYNVGMNSGGIVKRMKVIFSGRVQGIGFRYTVCHVAEAFEVSGYVCNLMDGDVELVAEGTEQELAGFLKSIRSKPSGRYVTGQQVRWLPATNEYNGFGIFLS